MSNLYVRGGLVRWFLEKRKKGDEKERKDTVENGVLYSSGLIAGEGLVGIGLAVLALIPKAGHGSFGDFLGTLVSGTFINSNIGGMVFFALLIAAMLLAIRKKAK